MTMEYSLLLYLIGTATIPTCHSRMQDSHHVPNDA